MMDTKEMQKRMNKITKTITQELGRVIGTRPYITVIDRNGTIHYSDESEFKEFGDYLVDFTRMNFNMLNIGDHSIPLSGKNLVFFKVSNSVIIVLFTKKGLVGQLLGYKSDLLQYASELQDVIGEVAPIEEQAVVDSGVAGAASAASVAIEVAPMDQQVEQYPQVFPRLIKPIKEKERFLIDQMAVLRYCDGNHDIVTISKETGLDVHTVYSILDAFEAKKRVELNIKGDIIEKTPMYIKPIPALAMELGLITPKELEVSKLCNGKYTVSEILGILNEKGINLTMDELNAILEKMQKKKYIKMRVKII
ncbi:MAG: hypothetical protein ACTSRW_13030 [Candidatus Helarchaeota archaeon]